MDYKTKTKLILPFKGLLMISNGGRTVETNNHLKFAGGAGPQNQLYAYDFRLGPHIHFNLQDGSRMHLAHALSAQFAKILVNGEVKTNYEPVRFEVVANI